MYSTVYLLIKTENLTKRALMKNGFFIVKALDVFNKRFLQILYFRYEIKTMVCIYLILIGLTKRCTIW